MRKFVIFAMLALFLGSAIGSEKPKREYRYGDKGYFGTARANYIMWNFDSSIPAVSVDIINGYSFNPWFMLGGGLGVVYTHYSGDKSSDNKSHGAVRVPVYLHLRGNLLDRRVTPFLAVNLGGGFCKGYAERHLIYHPEIINHLYGFLYEEVQLGVAARLKGGQMIDFGLSVPLDIMGHGANGGLKFSFGYTW